MIQRVIQSQTLFKTSVPAKQEERPVNDAGAPSVRQGQRRDASPLSFSDSAVSKMRFQRKYTHVYTVLYLIEMSRERSRWESQSCGE